MKDETKQRIVTAAIAAMIAALLVYVPCRDKANRLEIELAEQKSAAIAAENEAKAALKEKEIAEQEAEAARKESVYQMKRAGDAEKKAESMQKELDELKKQAEAEQHTEQTEEITQAEAEVTGQLSDARLTEMFRECMERRHKDEATASYNPDGKQVLCEYVERLTLKGNVLTDIYSALVNMSRRAFEIDGVMRVSVCLHAPGMDGYGGTTLEPVGLMMVTEDEFRKFDWDALEGHTATETFLNSLEHCYFESTFLQQLDADTPMTYRKR